MNPSPEIPEKEIRDRCATLLKQATEEARRLGHNYIGTEHLFIAAARDEESNTCDLLRRAGLNPRMVRNEIRREIGTLDTPVSDVLPLTPRTAMVLSLGIFLADQDKSREVQESHMLLALLQEGEGVPVRKLIDMGFDLTRWLQEIINEQQDFASPALASDENDFWDNDSDFDLDFSDEFLIESRPGIG
ncbi:MAG: Clp protease N-terminal domain-containing protein, partial [Aggregatilineales bacterium]